MQTRAYAAKIINDVVLNRHSLSKRLEQSTNTISNPKDRAFLQDLSYGVLRWYDLLHAYLDQLIDKPLKTKDSDIKHLMLIGLYQIRYQNTPDHAAVSECVNACNDFKKTWAKKLINAVLRRFIREQASIEKAINATQSLSHPTWIIEQLKHDWPNHYHACLESHQLQAPLTLRINQTKITRDAYLKELEQQSIEAIPCRHSPVGIQLKKSCDVTSLPGYAKGWFSVQDEAAQFAATLLDLQKQHLVLDACAAPGGKTSHCLELEPELAELTALDNNPTRLKRTQENLQRLDVAAKICCGDASKPEAWWDQRLFDRILLDVPCSAFGIIRRHPDIKFLRQKQDIKTITMEQQTILKNIWPLLKSGGKLLYSTCSILKAENDEQINVFMQQHDDVKLEALEHNWGIKTEYGVQILPGQDDMDGFYYCLLSKR